MSASTTTAPALGVRLSATVTLNATQMAAAYATPVQLIAAPGSGVCIFVLNAFISTHKGSSAFATGTAPIIQYGNTVHGGGTAAVGSGLVAGDITATTDQTRNVGPIASAANTGFSNTGIYFSNATGAYTAGSGSTVSFTLDYILVASAN